MEARSAPVNYRTAAGALAAIVMTGAGFMLGGMHADIIDNRRALVAAQVKAAKLAERLDGLEDQLRIVRSVVTDRLEIQRSDRGR